MSAHILIVEDENDLAEVVADYVKAAGFDATIIGNGAEALAHVQRSVPDLIVLDIMLPGMEGWDVCRAVRQFSDVPIVMVTAKVEEIDRLLGLDTGADDYLCKPFSPRELVARIKVILRRSGKADRPAPALAVDEQAQRISVRGSVLDLTPSEYAILGAMARHPGVVFSRAQLLDLANHDSLDVTDRAVDSHIKNLRRKLAEAAPGLEAIHSIYGLGYRLDV
jgi:two-component system response regulator BaeR